MTWASRPITTRPCIDLGSHGPLQTGLGMKASPCLAKKGWFFMAGDCGGMSSVKSRARGAIRPFRAHGLVRFADSFAGKRGERIRARKLRQRPYRSPANQRARIAKQAFCFLGK